MGEEFQDIAKERSEQRRERKGKRKGDDRVEIPLRMLTGNLDALLEGPLEVTTIHLLRDPASPFGVILAIRMTEEQQAAAAERGFRTKKVEQ